MSREDNRHAPELGPVGRAALLPCGELAPLGIIGPVELTPSLAIGRARGQADDTLLQFLGIAGRVLPPEGIKEIHLVTGEVPVRVLAIPEHYSFNPLIVVPCEVSQADHQPAPSWG